MSIQSEVRKFNLEDLELSNGIVCGYIINTFIMLGMETGGNAFEHFGKHTWKTAPVAPQGVSFFGCSTRGEGEYSHCMKFSVWQINGDNNQGSRLTHA